MSTQQSKDIAALVESYINASQEGRRLLVERSEEIAFLYPARGRKRPKNAGGGAKFEVIEGTGTQTAAASQKGAEHERF